MRASVERVTGVRVASRCRWVYMGGVSVTAACAGGKNQLFCRPGTRVRPDRRRQSWPLGLHRAAAQRVVVKTPLAHAAHGGEELVIVVLIRHRVDGRGVDDEKGGGVELVEEARVGLVQPLEVAAVDVLLVVDAAPGDA